MRVPLLISIGFHLAIVVFAVFGLPSTSPSVVLDHRVIKAQVISETQAPEPTPKAKPAPPPPPKKVEKKARRAMVEGREREGGDGDGWC